MIHGWPLLTAALTAGVLLWGRIGHHAKREASRFIPSMLRGLERNKLGETVVDGNIYMLTHIYVVEKA
jgi:hypothetical protein